MGDNGNCRVHMHERVLPLKAPILLGKSDDTLREAFGGGNHIIVGTDSPFWQPCGARAVKPGFQAGSRMVAENG